MSTVTLNMNMFLSNTGFTGRNTVFIIVWLRPRNTWIPIQHVGSLTYVGNPLSEENNPESRFCLAKSMNPCTWIQRNPRGLPVALATWIPVFTESRGDNEYRIRDYPRRVLNLYLLLWPTGRVARASNYDGLFTDRALLVSLLPLSAAAAAHPRLPYALGAATVRISPDILM